MTEVEEFLRDPFDGKGTLWKETATERHWMWIDPETGIGHTCVTEWTGPIYERNKLVRNDQAGTRWGDGKIVASMDMNTYFKRIVPARQNDDEKWIKRFLNNTDNVRFRTRDGTI